MYDLNSPANRQKFLKAAINKIVLIKKLTAVKKEAIAKSMFTEAKMIARLIDDFERDTENNNAVIVSRQKLRQR